MRLNFTWLVAINFKSFDELELDLAAYGPGLHFFRGTNKLDKNLGSNGAGKSTVWDAICWCLYGRTPNGLRNTDVRSWFSDKVTSVCVVLNDKRIMRTAGPNRLTIDEKSVGQEQVDKLVGINADTFFNTIVLGQGRPLFYDMPPREKMALFSTVLDLDRWDERSDRARDKVVRLDKLAAELNGQLMVMQDRWDVIDKELNTLRDQTDEWADAQSKKLSGLDRDLKQAREQYKSLGKEWDLADLAYDGAMMDLRLLDKDEDRVMQQVYEADREWERHDIGIAKLREEADQLDFDLSLTPDRCSMCGQPIGGKDRKHVREHMLDRIDELDAKVKADKKGPRLLGRVQELKQELERLQATADGFRQRADKAKATLDMATPILAQLKAKVDSADLIEAELKAAENPYLGQLQARRKERDRLKVDVAQLNIRLDKLAGQVARTKFWVKAFKDVRLYVVDGILQELEMATNAMLPEVGLGDWRVLYDIEKTTKAGTQSRGLNVSILSPDNKEPVRWESWSGGEGQRLRIVGALAFSDVLLRHSGVEANLEVLDEPTQHLSGTGVRDLLEFLAGRAKGFERGIFYVDHQSVESAAFTSVTTIAKDDAGSRVLSTAQ